MLGITNPFSYEIPEYLGYDITKLRGNARFLEVVLNRDKHNYLYYDMVESLKYKLRTVS